MKLFNQIICRVTPTHPVVLQMNFFSFVTFSLCKKQLLRYNNKHPLCLKTYLEINIKSKPSP